MKQFGIIPAAILLGLAACGAGDDAAEAVGRRRTQGPVWAVEGGPEQVSVMAARARREPISAYILSHTTLEAIRQVTAYARLSAIVEEIAVEEGESVSSGDLLLRLEDREIRNEELQARIAVDQARLGLEQARVQARQAEASYRRARSLFEEKLTSQQEFDQAVLASRTEELALQNAEQQLEAAQARLEAAEIQLDYTRIRSPIDGVVTERLVNVGDRVNGSQPVFNLADLSVLWARIYVPERELPQIRIGQEARLEIDTYPDHRPTAVVKMISPAVDPASGTFKVTLEVREQGRLLRPGIFGTVRIATETRPRAVVIPKKAVLRERDEDRVFVIGTDQTVEKRTVIVGFSDQDRVEVREGLAAGEAVVTVGYEGLGDGYAVSVLDWEGAPEMRAGPGPPAQTAPAARMDPPPLEGGRPEGMPRGPRADRLEQLELRLLGDPAIREEYESRLARDPSLSTDPEKKMAFFREMMQRVRRSRGVE